MGVVSPTAVDQVLDEWLATHSPTSVVVSYSGGVDSHVLLHALSVRQSPSLQVRAVHFDHGWHKRSLEWVHHCEEAAALLSVSVFVYRVPSDIPHTEEAARAARYAYAESHVQAGEWWLTAHTANDQAETVLHHMVRGSGLSGLGGIPLERRQGHVRVGRPLLSVTRDDMLSYAVQHGLDWVEDPSNHDVSYARNYIRHSIVPLLQARWPESVQAIVRAASHCRMAQGALQYCLQEPLSAVMDDVGRLQLASWRALSGEIQREVLRAWLRHHELVLEGRHWVQLLACVIGAAPDAQPSLRCGGVVIRRYQQCLSVELAREFSLEVATWAGDADMHFPHGRIVWQRAQGCGLRLDGESVTVRFRQGGERIRLVGRQHTHSVKKLWQEWSVPPWQRDLVPFIYAGDEIACILGYGTSHSYLVTDPQEWGWVVKWVPLDLTDTGVSNGHKEEAVQYIGDAL